MIQKKFLQNYLLLACYCTLLLMAAACQSTKKLKSTNYAYLYHPTPTASNAPQPILTKLHHLTADSTHLYFAVPTQALFFDTLNPQKNILTCFFSIQSIQKNKDPESNYSQPFFADTLTISYNIDNQIFKAVKNITFKQLLKLPQGLIYTIHLQLKQPNAPKKTTFEAFTTAFKNDNQNDQNYLLTTNSPFEPIIFNNTVRESTQIFVQYQSETQTPFYITYSEPSKVLALPTFVQNQKTKFYEKSTQIIENENNTFYVAKKGMYFIQKNTEDITAAGYTLLVTDKFYPELRQATDLLETVRYIAKNEEYQKMQNAKNIKTAIDTFWLKRAGNIEHGRKLIKTFYNRVQNANMLFTDCREGWKTDKGLVYIIYGEPQKVIFKSNALQEEWTYNYPDGTVYQRFVFEYLQNPFGTQTYMLIRLPEYEQGWHLAVYEWRKGIVFSTNK